MLKNSHEKLKNYINLYFSLYEMQFIPTLGCALIDRGKILVVPLMLGLAAFFSIWYLLVQMETLENIFALTFNVNITISSVQSIVTFLTINVMSKEKLLKALVFFDDIADTKVEHLTKSREKYLTKNLKIAWKIVRLYIIGILSGSLIFMVIGILQTNYTSPLYYRIPGIPSNSIWMRPLNIIVQTVLFYIYSGCIVNMDCLILSYLFYFRGELYAINAIAEMLCNKEENSKEILVTIYTAHRRILHEFSEIYNLLWHFYCQKLFAVSLYLCSGFFVFARINQSISIGVLLQSFIVCQLIILCMPGQLTDNCSEKLRGTLYMNFWYEMKLEDQKNLLMLMIGAQRNIQAKTIGIGRVSVYTLVQVIKTAISYALFIYAVLL
uniref:Odorant receptor n=1 Tax=Lutzomyia longipalpis TaxID=7200 RepID=A0A240SXU3_LUTLO